MCQCVWAFKCCTFFIIILQWYLLVSKQQLILSEHFKYYPIYIYIYIWLSLYIYIYIHIHTDTYSDTCIYIYIYMLYTEVTLGRPCPRRCPCTWRCYATSGHDAAAYKGRQSKMPPRPFVTWNVKDMTKYLLFDRSSSLRSPMCLMLADIFDMMLPASDKTSRAALPEKTSGGSWAMPLDDRSSSCKKWD